MALLAVVARNFVASEMRSGVEREALRTSAAASRVVADLIAPQAAQQGSALDDNLMVWVRRLIDEDANIFAGTQLQATSERTVFASGLLPSRTPADVYRGAGAAARGRRGGARADRRLRVRASRRRRSGSASIDAMMTVPLTSRQRDIDMQIDALDRRVLLAALIFILGRRRPRLHDGRTHRRSGEPADPRHAAHRRRRLRRARGRPPRPTSCARLVADFNQMASELQRQRRQLERTHRIEAWAEMARQVAHDIKNPLTPIQLNAEHLRRVHADRGEPLGPVLKECVDTILSQVASAAPDLVGVLELRLVALGAARRWCDVADLLTDLVGAVRARPDRRLSIEVRSTPPLPPVLDRSRARRRVRSPTSSRTRCTPCPRAGALTIEAAAAGRHAWPIEVSDTGGGMDDGGARRARSSPTSRPRRAGTGLGLPIAKRNVELSGGTIAITSQRDHGTTRRGAPAVAT